MIINTQTVKKSSGGNNNYSVLGGILDDDELIYPSTKTPTVFTPSNNPADYTKVNWLESTSGTDFIITPIMYSEIGSGSFECEYCCNDRTQGYGVLGGYFPDNFNACQVYSNTTEVYVRWGSQSFTYQNSDTNFHKVGGSPSQVYFDNNVNSISESGLSRNKLIVLFARENGNTGTVESPLKGKMKYFWIKDSNGQYIHNLLPVYHTELGYRGFFDIIENELSFGGWQFGIPSDTSNEINLAEYLASLT